MSNYIEVNIRFTPSEEMYADIMSAILGEKGFESFTFSDDVLKAYVSESVFSESLLKEAKDEFPMDVEITSDYEIVESKNWNEEWEKNYFQPIVIGNECVIHSSFHQDTPEARFDILIDPKMSFGTGHHETTSLMLAELLKLDVTGKSFLDMGCGTAVLAILARMKDASPVTAIDIDEWAYENSLENIRLNHVSDITVKLGGAELLGTETYDIILANINRNILLHDMHRYISCMHTGSLLFMSGFYTEDIPMIREEAEKHGLTFVSHSEKNRWVAVQFIKN